MPPRKAKKVTGGVLKRINQATTAGKVLAKPAPAPTFEIAIPITKPIVSSKKRKWTSDSSDVPPSPPPREPKKETKAKPPVLHDPKDLHPAPEEWADVKVFTRFGVCSWNGLKWRPGDFVNWAARIQAIRANGTERVFCEIAWLYTTSEMLEVDASCRNVPSSKIIQFPEEVVLGQGAPFTALISLQCIDNLATIVKFDEAAPLQKAIPYDGTVFYRSIVRAPTAAEVKKEEMCAEKAVASRRQSRMWNAKLPIHVFERNTTCFCKKRYTPLPVDSGPMIFCPRKGCCRWYHLACLQQKPELRMNGVSLIPNLTQSGLDLLWLDRAKNQDHLTEISIKEDTAYQSGKYLHKFPADPRGIPLSLIQAAEVSITRGTQTSGIVGNARRVLEARDLYRTIQVEIESAKHNGTGAHNLRGKEKAAGSSKMVELLDKETMMKLGNWMRVYGDQKEEDEGNGMVRRSEFWKCPNCKDAI